MSRKFLLLLLAWLLVGPVAWAQKKPKTLVTAIVPSFKGDPEIGLHVGSVLNLELWRTLIPPEGQPSMGKVGWSTLSLENSSHEGADMAAMNNSAQMVLWGEAWRVRTAFLDDKKVRVLSEGVAVQSLLSIPDYDDIDRDVRPEHWIIPVKIGAAETEGVLDLPTRRYQFSVFVLQPEAMKEFDSVGTLKLYADSNLKSEKRGDLGNRSFTAEFHKEGWSQIKVNGMKNSVWLRRPQLSKDRPYVVEFVGGIIRLFRADYPRTLESFGNVLKMEKVPVAIQVDCHLLSANAAANLGRDPRVHTRKALELDPDSRTVAEYHMAALCFRLSDRQRPTPAEKEANVKELQELLAKYGYLFPVTDGWIYNEDHPTIDFVKTVLRLARPRLL